MAENLNNPAADETSIPFPGILIADRFQRPHGYRVIRKHGTRDWIITFTLGGSGQFLLHDQSFSCHTGDIVILKPGTPHYYETAADSVWQFVWAHYVPNPAWTEWLLLPEPAEGIIKLHIEPNHLRERILHAFDRIIADSMERSFHYQSLAMNGLEEALMLIALQAKTNASQTQHDPRVMETIRMMNLDIRSPHRIDQLARHVSLSPSRLAHLFKQQTGDSILETLIKLRLRQAAKLLEFTDRQISEISEDVGFHNPFYFTKQFTAFFGLNPTAYRKQLR